MNIFGALLYGLANLLHPRMLWLMIWPMLLSLAIWGAAALALWTRTTLWLAELLSHWLEPAAGFVRFDFGNATMIAANVVLFLVFVPLVYITALFILSIFGMPKMVDYVAERSFPALERRHGGSIAGSIWNGFVALAGMVLLFLVSLPLWILPPLWPLIPLAIFGWVNQRLLRYDALAEHADRLEMARMFRERRGALFLMGVLLALLAYVPFVGFIGPVVFGLAFIRYMLGALQELRARGSGVIDTHY
jgi:CysZ protein